MTPTISLLLVDDHASYRRPLAMLLDREPDVTVIAQVGTVAELRKTPATVIAGVDLVLTDLHLPDGDGVEVVHFLCGVNPRVQVIILTAVVDPKHHQRAIAAGASSVLSKAAHPAEIVAQVRSVHVVRPRSQGTPLTVSPGSVG